MLLQQRMASGQPYPQLFQAPVSWAPWNRTVKDKHERTREKAAMTVASVTVALLDSSFVDLLKEDTEHARNRSMFKDLSAWACLENHHCNCWSLVGPRLVQVLAWLSEKSGNGTYIRQCPPHCCARVWWKLVRSEKGPAPDKVWEPLFRLFLKFLFFWFQKVYVMSPNFILKYLHE